MSFFGGNSKKIEDRQAQAPQHARREETVLEPPQETRPTYGIRNAILLMRTVPIDQNAELVVAVIKTTLESLKVKVTDIIEDASRRQHEIETRIADLRQQIVEYEREILARKDEIGRLEADHAETTMVKGRLELAERAPRGHASPVHAQPVHGEVAYEDEPELEIE
jgi:hypothetical protein